MTEAETVLTRVGQYPPSGEALHSVVFHAVGASNKGADWGRDQNAFLTTENGIHMAEIDFPGIETRDVPQQTWAARARARIEKASGEQTFMNENGEMEELPAMNYGIIEHLPAKLQSMQERGILGDLGIVVHGVPGMDSTGAQSTLAAFMVASEFIKSGKRDSDIGAQLARAVVRANNVLAYPWGTAQEPSISTESLQAYESKPRLMACAVVLSPDGREGYAVHAGNGRVYRVDRNTRSAELLTADIDSSWDRLSSGGRATLRGYIGGAFGRTEGDLGVRSYRLGSGDSASLSPFPVTRFTLEPRQFVVLCSSGVWRGLPDDKATRDIMTKAQRQYRDAVKGPDPQGKMRKIFGMLLAHQIGDTFDRPIEEVVARLTGSDVVQSSRHIATAVAMEPISS